MDIVREEMIASLAAGKCKFLQRSRICTVARLAVLSTMSEAYYEVKVPYLWGVELRVHIFFNTTIPGKRFSAPVVMVLGCEHLSMTRFWFAGIHILASFIAFQFLAGNVLTDHEVAEAKRAILHGKSMSEQELQAGFQLWVGELSEEEHETVKDLKEREMDHWDIMHQVHSSRRGRLLHPNIVPCFVLCACLHIHRVACYREKRSLHFRS